MKNALCLIHSLNDVLTTGTQYGHIDTTSLESGGGPIQGVEVTGIREGGKGKGGGGGREGGGKGGREGEREGGGKGGRGKGREGERRGNRD